MEKLTPILKNYLWGGEKLKLLFGRNGEDRIAESWEVSVHPDGESRLGDGSSFSEYLKRHPGSVDRKGDEFPVLIKYIDAAKPLSVQVHPNDEYARRYEHDNGKTEMWYILSAEAGAGIYCGFRENTDRESFLKSVAAGEVEKLLNFIPVKSGDCYLIKAGTVHAIGAGCVICEVQQSSNVTYRVYDYNRRDAEGKLRELHIDKAAEVIDFRKFSDETNSGAYIETDEGMFRVLTACPYFLCRELLLNGRFEERGEDSFTAANILAGSGGINGENFSAGDSFFLSCGEKLSLRGKARILLTSENHL